MKKMWVKISRAWIPVPAKGDFIQSTILSSANIRVYYDDNFDEKFGSDAKNAIRRILAHTQHVWKWPSLTTKVIFKFDPVVTLIHERWTANHSLYVAIIANRFLPAGLSFQLFFDWSMAAKKSWLLITTNCCLSSISSTAKVWAQWAVVTTNSGFMHLCTQDHSCKGLIHQKWNRSKNTYQAVSCLKWYSTKVSGSVPMVFLLVATLKTMYM